MLNQFLIVAVFAIAGFFFGVLALVIARLLAPFKPSSTKLSTYECGLETQGPTWVQFKVNYFLYALVFLLFDVSIVFLYPWAVQFASLSWLAFGAVLVFILIMLMGLFYAWKGGALEWK